MITREITRRGTRLSPTYFPSSPGSIIVRDLYKRHDGAGILHGVSFTAEPGTITAFLGQNGAGKSSSIRFLLGLDRTDRGMASFDGLPYPALDRPLTRVGALLDGVGGARTRRVSTHLAIVAERNGIAPRRVPEVLEVVSLSARRSVRLGTLSLGASQRAGLATALLGNPQCLIMDEPTNGLDPAGIRWFRLFIRDQADIGRSVILSSHMLSEVQEVADRIVVIRQGRIVLDADLADALP